MKIKEVNNVEIFVDVIKDNEVFYSKAFKMDTKDSILISTLDLGVIFTGSTANAVEHFCRITKTIEDKIFKKELDMTAEEVLEKTKDEVIEYG
jgi:hypothetical protein